MAILKDSVVTGSLRVTDTLYSNTNQFTVLNIPTASNGTTFGPGTNGQILKSNGTSVYWASDNNSDVNVKQLAAITTAGAYPLILANSTATTEVTGTVNKASTLTYNPNTKALVTGGTVNGYTLAAACAKGVTDNSSNTDVTSSDTNLITGRTLYYQLAKKGYTTNTGTVTKVSTGVGLTGGDVTTTGTVKAKLRSETALTNDSAAATETSGRVYPVAVDKSGYLAVNVPWANDNTKNTAGTTNKTGTKMFLAAATEQSANPTTYSNSNCYIGTDDCLYSGGTKVLTAHQDISGKLNLSGGTLTGRLTTAKTINQIITGSGTAASDKGEGVSPRYFPAQWKFNTGLTATNGDIITIKVPVAGHTYGVFMSIDNGTNYYPVVLNGTGRLTTHYPKNTQIMVMFDSSGSAADMMALAGADARATVSNGVWRVLNYYDSNTTYSPATLGSGYGTCTTAAATAAKVVTLSSYALVTGGIVAVKFTYGVPANATLNINSRGAKAIYYNGKAITAGIIEAGNIATFIYNGQYHLITVDKTVVPFIKVANSLSVNKGATATYKLPGLELAEYTLVSMYGNFTTKGPSGMSFSWSVDTANGTFTLTNTGTVNISGITPIFGLIREVTATKQ